MANIDFSILTPSDEPAWEAYVNSHSEATIYHTLEWRDILYNEYRFEPVYLIAKEGEKVVGVLPIFLINNLRGKRLVSLPFSIYGGPLADSAEISSALICKCMEMVKEGKASNVEIKPHTHIGCNDAGLEAVEWGIGTTLDLSLGIDVLWKRLTDRNDVKRAIKEGLKFSLSDGEGMGNFYKLQLMTRKRLGLPVPRLRYYKSFFEKMPGLVKLALVEKGDTAIAGGIFFAYKDTILYALGASDHRHLYARPNDLLIWEMMKWAAESGYKTFDLGPTPSSDSGLLHFKKKWGGEQRKVVRHLFPEADEALRASRVKEFASSLLRVSPIWLHTLLGRQIIKGLG